MTKQMARMMIMVSAIERREPFIGSRIYGRSSSMPSHLNDCGTSFQWRALQGFHFFPATLLPWPLNRGAGNRQNDCFPCAPIQSSASICTAAKEQSFLRQEPFTRNDQARLLQEGAQLIRREPVGVEQTQRGAFGE